METGVVKFYNATTKQGVIELRGSGAQIAVSATGLVDNIRTGDRVSFEIVESNRGPVAVNVRLA